MFSLIHLIYIDMYIENESHNIFSTLTKLTLNIFLNLKMIRDVGSIILIWNILLEKKS